MKTAGILLACCLTLVACSDRSGSDVTGVVFVTLDTTRADRIGCYGYEAAETPHLDALAAEGTLFSEVQSPVPVTLPAHSTMFTGNYPPVHGVRYNGMFTLGEGSVTIAERLKDAGWDTVGMPAAYPLTAKTGIGQGFDLYRDLFEELEEEDLPETGERNAAEITAQAVEWLSSRGDEPFLLWLHYFDAHDPYKPPFPYSAKYRDKPYDGEIAFVDQQLGKLFDALKAERLWDNVLIIVVGDHGEALYEHGEKFHSNLAYQSTLHVPLIIRGPSVRSGRVVDVPVSLVDLAPTVLDYTGQVLHDMNGISLRPALEGGDLPTRALYFESLAGSLSFGWSPLEGIRAGSWKYIRSVSPELFNLKEDPGEMEDRLASEDLRAAEMEQELSDLLEDFGSRDESLQASDTPLDPEEAERLASLGYVGGAIVATNRNGANPRDMIHLESAIHFARKLQMNKQYGEALEAWRPVLEADPTNRHALHLATIAAFKVGRMDEGIRLGNKLNEAWPDFAPGFVALGEGYAQAGRYREAADVFFAGLTTAEGDNGLSYRLVVALYAGGRTREAVEIARRILASGGEPYYRVILSACLAKQGDLQSAGEELRTAITDGYQRRDVLETEPLLEPLRKVPDFVQMISALPRPETADESPDGQD